MIDATERLLAERGIDAVSLREVQAAAGQRNTSAAQYHFGSRAGLIDAIIVTRMGPVDLARRRHLDDLDGDGVTATTVAYVPALVEPLADATVRRSRSWYGRFLARSYTDPVWAGAVADSGHGTSLVAWHRRLEEHLTRTLDASVSLATLELLDHPMGGPVYVSTRITRDSATTPSWAIASAASSLCMAAMRASRSATSMRTATWVGFSGLTNVLMFVTPRGPKISSRFGEVTQ